VNATLNEEAKSAELEYSNHDEARACHKSPEPIFGNRFVKVFWKPVEGREKPKTVRLDPEILRANLARKEEKRKEALALEAEKQKHLQEIQKSTSQLISKQMEEQQKVMEKLRNPSLNVDERAVLMKGLEMLQSSIKTLMASIAKPQKPQFPPARQSRTFARRFAVDPNQMDTDIPDETSEKMALYRELEAKIQSMGGNSDPGLYAQFEQLKSEVLIFLI
jgi:hypothetical protein